jgi:hypothetical protein
MARPVHRWFDALATRIAEGAGRQEELAACTGEEMALHLADLAEAHLADGVIGPHDASAASLPDHGDADRDFDTMRDVLSRDNDVLVLFDPLMEAPRSLTGSSTGSPATPTSTRETGSSPSR